jgi:hypothetical protein
VAWATGHEERQVGTEAARERAKARPATPLRRTIARLYLIVRTNLPPGDQAVQADHAHREFIEHHREVEASWYRESNTLALLAARDEQHLGELYRLALERGIPAAPFREPDLGDSLTAVAFAPSAGRLFAGLPPALKAG